MTLLDLTADIWTSYVLPLVGLSGTVRLAGCSRASADLTLKALHRASSVVITVPNDLHACLMWLSNRSLSTGHLIVERGHLNALMTAKKQKFAACFRAIALKFPEGSSDIMGVYDNDMVSLLHNKLTVLEIEAAAVAPETLMDHCLGCQNLHAISFKALGRYTECNPTWLAKIIRSNPKLQKLHIDQHFLVDDEVFDAIAERKDTLTDVTMLMGSLEGIEPDHLRRLLESCPSLRKLEFWSKGGQLRLEYGLIGMEGKCPQLEELILPNILFTRGSLHDFILCCPKLRVCLADGGRITDQDLKRWHRTGVPKLRDFSLGWAVEQRETVVACAALFEEVRTYRMGWSEHCETAAEALAYMPHLHTVCLYSHQEGLLARLVRFCPQLRVLRFMPTIFVSSAGQVAEALVALLSSLCNLEELQWTLKTGFGEAGLMALAQHCPNLRSLDCESIDVTDAGLIALVRGCPALKTLRLWRCCKEGVTDAFLHAIAQHCPHLEELRLPSWFWTPSPAAVNAVLAACTSLRVLYVPWNQGQKASSLVVPAGRLRRLIIT